MEEIRIERLTEDHFHLHSLDNFIRHQIVKECWRKADGQWVLLPIAFVEEWSLEKCREEAAEIIRHQHGKMVDYGAFQGKNLLGYIPLGQKKSERKTSMSSWRPFRYRSRSEGWALEESSSRRP